MNKVMIESERNAREDEIDEKFNWNWKKNCLNVKFDFGMITFWAFELNTYYTQSIHSFYTSVWRRITHCRLTTSVFITTTNQ